MHLKVETVLTRCGVAFKEYRHCDFPEPVHAPADFARQLDYGLARITKTILLRSRADPPFSLAVAPVDARMKFPALAQQLGVKKVEVASEAELLSITGYPRNGVSPLGVEGACVFIDSSLFNFKTILVGAGLPGVELEIAPQDLAFITGAISLSFAL